MFLSNFKKQWDKKYEFTSKYNLGHKFNEINVIYQGIKKDPNNILINSNKNEKRQLYF